MIAELNPRPKCGTSTTLRKGFDCDARAWNKASDKGEVGYVAARYSLSPRTITKYRKDFPVKPAEMLLMPPSDGDTFYLLLG